MSPDVLEQPFVLPADATLVPLAELSPRMRSALGNLDDASRQVAVSRVRHRVPTRLVTPELAALLGEFREPTRIVDAVLRFSRASSRDPFETLEDAFDALAAFIDSTVLVPAGDPAAQAVAPTLAAGQEVAGCEVERVVGVLADTEVYHARTRTGAPVALKVARPDATAAVMAALAAEARILEHLGGGVTPALLDHGTQHGRAFLVQEWRAGVTIDHAAARARAGDRAGQHALCRAVLVAYAWLHAQGVVHGDVHPGNLIAGVDGSVSIVDFGRGRLIAEGAVAGTGRAGIAHFWEPELASALLSGHDPPPPTAAGEQYALGALLYHLITGLHYADLPVIREDLLHAVLQRSPLAFTARRGDPWPEVEAVLARALAKAPAQRFPDVAQFLAAFDAAAEAAPAAAVAGAPAGRRLVARCLARARKDADPAAAAGLAWLALRAAQARDDPELLATADVRASRAAAAAGRPDLVIASVAGAVAHARGDVAAQTRAAGDLLVACRETADRPDLLGGRSGALVAASRAVDELRAADVEAGPLLAWIHEAVDATWQHVDPCGTHLGMAHGQAGLLFATLSACRCTGRPLPPAARALLDDLAARAEPVGEGVRWPGTVRPTAATGCTPDRAPGWCSGSAGHVLLWLLAGEELDEPAFRDLALRAGRHALDHPGGGPDLCCGLSGRAFALLRLYQATGEPGWLSGARRLAEAAAGLWPPDAPSSTLRAGPLGTAVLLVELEAPGSAVLPILGEDA